jgi:dTDP-4-amino-4,6-dideoxygalactose transaminase
MAVTNSAEMNERLRVLRNHGQTLKYISSEPGWNSRLDEIQAAVLRVKLRYLSAWQKARQQRAEQYSQGLREVPGVITPVTPEGYEHVYHQYTIRVERRDALQKFLGERKIGSAVYYPVSLHLQPLYASLEYKEGDFPHAERAAQEVLSLPMYPELKSEQIVRVVDAIAEFQKCC